MREINVLGDMELEIADKSCRQTPYEEEHWIIRVNGEQKELEALPEAVGGYD
ncbi:hypothetical protein D3C78_1929100 [compost metagenome]